MSQAHARPQRAKRRILLIGLVSAGALSAMAVAALASGANQDEAGAQQQAAQQIVCPSPVAAIPAVPAAAQAEVTRELANLDKQLAEANARLVSTVGQGGPNFVQNAILGPLASKRTAALDRIETAIGRVAAKPQGLERFATCQLGGAGEAPPVAEPTAPATSAPEDPAAEDPAAEDPGAGDPAAGQIVCPSPVDAIPAVPAAAQAEVTRELANLDKQLAEANARLVSTVGQGGPNFVQNAILGPLASKRTAALDRIETAIGRVAAKPQGLERFATCQLG